ncbi:MAG: hypothetical protein H7641_02765, partial [Candidatus Heimdallarchaeota archaeon]|nr:hypothetical protein [Candidatus Heimdallarchaeota archaeon]MCK4876485.1 hypothetical protein [Candidatus Heimdallarchaeota archaeon]
MNLRSKYLWRTFLVFVIFVASNFLGFIFVFGKYEGGLEALGVENPFEEEVNLPYWFWNWIDIKSKDGRTLSRLHYLFGFSNPLTGEQLQIVLYFKVEPVTYDLLVNKEDFFDYVEASLFEITASSGNESLTYNTKYSIEKFSLTNEVRSYIQVVNIPTNWNISQQQYITFRFGNFRIIQGSRYFDASMSEGQTQILVFFNKSDFDLVESHTEGTIKRDFFTEFSILLNIALIYKILLTILIGLGVIFLAYIFSSEWFTQRHSKKLTKINQKKIATIPQIEIETSLKKIVQICKSRYYLYSIASINFIFAVLMFFIAYIWFGAPTGKYYTIITASISICTFLGYLFFVGRAKNKSSKIIEKVKMNDTVVENVKKINKSYEISF